jgi:hypothetical protein
MHNRLMGFSFNVMLLDVLKPKSPKRSSPATSDPPASGDSHRKQDHKKAATSVENMRQRATSS